MFPPPTKYATLTLWVDDSSCRCISVIFQNILKLLILHIFHLHLLATFPRGIHRNCVSSRADSLHSVKRSDESFAVSLSAASSKFVWINRQIFLSSSLSCSLFSKRVRVYTSPLYFSSSCPLPMGTEMLLFSNLQAPIGSQRRTEVKKLPNSTFFFFFFCFLDA